MIDLTEAHKHCSRNRSELRKSGKCGCFYCLTIFEFFLPLDCYNLRWAGDRDTLMCPICGIDSVIGDVAGYALTREFLEQMQERWFKRTRGVRHG